MDRYQRVEKPRNETPIRENEIRITALGRMRNYIGYGMSLLEENGHDEIIIKAMGRAINKTVMVAELIKRRVAGLHQNTSIESVGITDTWEPLEEGLVPLETTRHVSMISLTLSKEPLDTSSPGYQPPIPAEEVKPAFDYEHEGSFPSARGRGRGGPGGGRRGRGRAINNGPPAYDWGEEWEEDGDYYHNGRGRGRGRLRGRGRARGYYGGGRRGGYGYDHGYGGRGGYYEEQGGYFDGEPDEYQPPPARGRGRGRTMEQSEYYNGEPDEYQPPPGRGRGRGRRMEQSEYYNGEPDEYRPPGRGRGRGRWMEQSEYFDEPYEYPPPGRGRGMGRRGGPWGARGRGRGPMLD
ncbi:hypothetical protein D1007_31998 [Hordeum vulgare]|uniref:DNA/RNA-binding protein Alba-like domain-containing protein n=1 Tax=Hordeum vulgare subsp. vulgare TaxID=112509 RepID=A0A8I6XGL3_HORVV|nr:TATA-binding protein-associated factor 2N-like isoform X1 [Hordeum vulgare subsp. vulgare]KAE8793414.1 hypothetical protein D1007_31998 [Hordeum vulgare]